MVNNPAQHSRMNLPDTDRLSVLIALGMLAYVLAQIIELPIWTTAFSILGSYFTIEINAQNLVGLFVAGLTASGADWLLNDHPEMAGRSTLPHIVLPGLVALMLNLGLQQLPFNLFWWLALIGGGAVLVLVLLGEYISINSEDVRQPFAVAVLTAVTFASYMVFSTILRTAELRLYLILPAISVGTVLASLRILHLRLPGEWLIYEALIIGFIVSQCAAALHYWPVSPVSFGLLVLGATYALNSLMISLIEEKALRRLWLEPVIAVLTAITAAWFLR